MKKQQAKEKFIKYLGENGLSVTAQRIVIFDVFVSMGKHFSTEELYEAVKRHDASIGQATVYRTLKLLVDSGLARGLDFGDSFTRYEPQFGEEHHDHLVCESCGKNVEILVPEIERLQEEAARKHGFILTNHKMNLYGLCSECRKKKK